MSGEVVVPGHGHDVARALRSLLRPDNTLVAGDVVAAAAAPSSPLHPLFDWDDTSAARQYRLVQAGLLIRRAKVTVLRGEDEEPVRVRAYVAVRDVGREPDEAGTYMPIEDVAGRSELEGALLAAMRRDVRRLQRRYSDHQEALRQMVAEVLDVDG